MQAIVTLPSSLSGSMSLSKISSDIYWSQASDRFYKLSVQGHLTMFIANDLATRQNLVMTQFSPIYLALQYLVGKSEVKISELPEHLRPEHLAKFCHQEGAKLILDKSKVSNFVEAKINKVLDTIESRQYNRSQAKHQQKTGGQDLRRISVQVLEYIKRTIPPVFVEQLVNTKFHLQKTVRPVVMDSYEEQADKEEQLNVNKPKKKPALNKLQFIPKNQPTLFQFNKKGSGSK